MNASDVKSVAASIIPHITSGENALTNPTDAYRTLPFKNILIFQPIPIYESS